MLFRVVFAGLLALIAQGALAAGQLEVVVTDRDTGQPLFCRMHLKNAAGRVVKPAGVAVYHDHFVVPGKLTLKLPNGSYTFELECGLEYLTRSGNFTIANFADDSKAIDMKRFAHLAKEGWWSGDLDVRRNVTELPPAMQADDLHLVPRIIGELGGKGEAKLALTQLVQTFDTDRLFHGLNLVDARGGGAVGLLNLREPLKIESLKPEMPSMLATITAASAQGDGVWCDVQQHASWDLPVWIAAGKVQSLQMANSHLTRDTINVKPPPGVYPRDAQRLPDPRGNARWSTEIYYHMLNCGVRIPPSAGSGSGVAPNPVGYNRVYAFIEGDFTYDKWFAALRQGRALVTNGPLIRPTVEGHPPGHVFEAAKGETPEFEIALTMSSRDKIHYLEIVKDGQVLHEVRLAEFVEKKGRLPTVKFTESGWFLVRAVTEVQKTYRFGMTAPYYVEIDGQKRVSRKSADFFLQWLAARQAQLKLPEGEQGEKILAEHRAAKTYWEKLRAAAAVE